MNRNLLSAAMFLVFASTSFGAPVYNPVTGHWYERVDAPLTWIESKAAAEARSYNDMQGYLATITSAQENWWIVSNLGGAETLDHWLGGHLEDGRWKWITGESWSYTNWWSSLGWVEPSGDGDALQFDDAEQTLPDPGYWNDFPKVRTDAGYIVEYTPVPLPGSFWLFGSGMAGIIGYIKFKRIKSA